MITSKPVESFSEIERGQLERKELARGAWAEGRTGDAQLILATVLSENMTPRVAAECHVTQAAFLAEEGDFEASLKALKMAALFLDSAGPRVKGSFFLQRGRVRRRIHDLDGAITDYTGAAVCFEQSGDKELEGASHLNLADTYVLAGSCDNARQSLAKAFLIFEPLESFYRSQAYDTLAKIELAEGHAELAIVAINKAFELVGDNEGWREDFELTRRDIRAKLLELLNVKKVQDLDSIRMILVERALIKTGGNLSHAGKLIGLSYKGVDYIVQQHSDLEQLRTERKRRLKSVIKNPT